MIDEEYEAEAFSIYSDDPFTVKEITHIIELFSPNTEHHKVTMYVDSQTLSTYNLDSFNNTSIEIVMIGKNETVRDCIILRTCESKNPYIRVEITK